MQQRYIAYVMWILPLLFFSYQFILRLWPGLLLKQIMEQFSVDASSFGILAALYYYGYSGAQIPVAMLLDRYSARYVVFASAVICGLSTLAFTYTSNWSVACMCRFAIGAGSAVGLLGVSKVISEWFNRSQYTRMIGFSFTIGLTGAIYGGKPIVMLVDKYDWHNVALILAVVSIVIGITNYLFLRQHISKIESKAEPLSISHFTVIWSSPLIWLLALINMLMVGALEGFADIWGVQYIMLAYDLVRADAAQLTSCIFIGMLFGGPLLAFLSNKIGNYISITICGLSIAFMLWLFLFQLHFYNIWVLGGVLFLVGVMSCYQLIIFAVSVDLVGAQYIGVTVATLNCANMLGGSFFHTIIGKIMDWHRDTEEYSLHDYRTALSLIPICAAVGALLTIIAWCVHHKSKNVKTR